MEYIPMPVTLS